MDFIFIDATQVRVGNSYILKSYLLCAFLCLPPFVFIIYNPTMELGGVWVPTYRNRVVIFHIFRPHSSSLILGYFCSNSSSLILDVEKASSSILAAYTVKIVLKDSWLKVNNPNKPEVQIQDILRTSSNFTKVPKVTTLQECLC